MRKGCKRRVYKLVDPIRHAIEGATKLPENDLDKVRGMELSAIQTFIDGTATRNEWMQLKIMTMLSYAMAKDGVDTEDVMPTIIKAKAALESIKERYKAKNVLGVAGVELMALREMYAWHDLQRTAIHRARYERAIVKVGDELKNVKKEEFI